MRLKDNKLMVFVVMFTPWLGVIVGRLQPRIWVAAAIGLLLWAGEQLLIKISGSRKFPDQKFPSALAFSTIFTFFAYYGFAYVVGAYMFHRQ